MLNSVKIALLVFAFVLIYNANILADQSIQISDNSVILNSSKPDQWDLTVDQAQKAEKLVKPFLESQKQLYLSNLKKFSGSKQEREKFKWAVDDGVRKIDYILKNFEKYNRQYVGMIENGQRFVWVNFFMHDDEFKEWKQEVIVVHDGGADFFNLRVDIDKNQCSNLQINGEA